MNNLKKLGVTALAGSLVAVSAQAGEMAINGSANFTYKTNNQSEGKGIGTDKGLTVSGSGELDNGWTFSLYTALSDAMGLTSHATSLTMGSLGTITAGQGWGGNGTSFDEEVPQAYEQASDLTAAGSSNAMGSFLGNGGLTWAVPSFDLGGIGSASLLLGWVPNADGAGNSNGGVGTRDDSSGVWGDGMDVGLTIATDMGLTVGVYAATRENNTPVVSGADNVNDEFNGTWYAKYNIGSVSLGYQTSYLDAGQNATASTATTAAKVVRTAGGLFEETQMSIAFNLNDNVSISYTDAEDVYDSQGDPTAGTTNADVSMDTEALQVSYSMGGMSISAYQIETQNPGYDSDATAHSASEVSIGLAF
jgi:outer membrane protein OmpU